MAILHRVLAGVLVLVFAGAALAQEFVKADPERLGMSAERLEVLDAGLKAYVDDDRIAGQVVPRAA